MKLETYQENAAEWLSRRRIGLVVAPAGSGKTVIAAAALDRVTRRKERTQPLKVGWIANTIEQCQQAQSALDMFKTPMLEVKIACAAAETDWSDRAGLIVDEAHHLMAAGWMAQQQACKGALWGLTATPKLGDELRDDGLLRMFSGEVFTVDRSEVQNRVTQARVILLDATDPGLQPKIDAEVQRQLPRRAAQMKWVAQKQGRRISDQEIYGQLLFQTCVDIGIVGNTRRNDKAWQTAARHSGNNDQVLVLVNQVEHAKWMSETIPGAMACYSKMGAKKRREALAAFKEGRVKCLVATSLADEGLDLPNANVLILVNGGRSNAKTEQRTGRVLRTFAGKDHGLIYDFHDYWHPLAAKHSRVRQELYRKLGYEIVLQGGQAV